MVSPTQAACLLLGTSSASRAVSSKRVCNYRVDTMCLGCGRLSGRWEISVERVRPVSRACPLTLTRRTGYGATTDGMWPYSYEACDVGTLQNQTLPNGTPNATAGQFGDPEHNYDLSWLPGQRLSSCTCPGEDHPGPKTSDGKWKARSAPEIDIFEAQITEDPVRNPLLGSVSQSCQFAPLNAFYSWDNTTGAVITDPTQTIINGFTGTV